MKKAAEQPSHLTDSQLNDLAFRLVAAVDGVPMGQALYLLTDLVPAILKDGHLVEAQNPRLAAIRAASG